ncbi:MAG: hypothetical protein GWN07_18160, partial [Actinobacteria bacterium]|nr:hypothetical protein [Actinomycetota bacterium]NIU67348.1 hypothetical protein [Actinomycetota bacterium]NIW29127.1 hypothetical protein [Actinomycetota bacterium]NIX21656.1 hypothetical protein [Actinomycetota bacterium]
MDRDGDGRDDLFDAPFDGTVRDGFHGTATRPDIRVVDRGFLDRLSSVLFAAAAREYPDHHERPRLASIAIWGPPTVPVAGD